MDEWHGQVCGVCSTTLSSTVVVIVVGSSLFDRPHFDAVLFLSRARDAHVTKNTSNYHSWKKIATMRNAPSLL